MNRRQAVCTGEKGIALVYMATIITGLLLISGLAVDSGRAYMVKVQLSKAVDGAALGAARNFNSGSPTAEATRIFNLNFPSGSLGTTSVSGPAVSTSTDSVNGLNIVNVSASAMVPTTFMRLANFQQVNVTASAQATRRMVDLSLIVDVSSSIGSKWSTVAAATRSFIDSFDQAHDRLSLITFSNGSRVIDAMPANRGFDKARLEGDVPNTLPGGSTLMVEGLYHGWDELRAVAPGSQSSLRIIVLFTDGASNGVPGAYDVSPATAKALRTWDFPKSSNDPDGQTWDAPHIDGLYDTTSGNSSPSYSLVPSSWNSTQTIPQIPLLPLTTWHQHGRAGTPSSFPLQSASVMVNGAPQTTRRALRHQDATTGRYPADVFNVNNAARNVLEIIASQARTDVGDYPIRIFTIGMGYLVRDMLGTIPEMPEDILKRVANDPRSADYNSAQLAGKYFFAQTEQEVAPAYQGIQNEIIRLSK